MAAPAFGAPLKRKLQLYAGQTYRDLMVWKVKPDAAGAYEPVDLTGCTARMQIRANLTTDEVALQLTTAVDGGIVLGGAAGTIERFISDEQTAALPIRKGVYDLEVVFPNGDVRRLVGGDMAVDPEVTRA